MHAKILSKYVESIFYCAPAYWTFFQVCTAFFTTFNMPARKKTTVDSLGNRHTQQIAFWLCSSLSSSNSDEESF